MATGTGRPEDNKAGSRITYEPDLFLEDGRSQVRQPDTDPTARTTVPAGFEERKEPVLFKFVTPGDTLIGHVAGFLRGMIGGKPGVAIFISVNERTDQFAKINATRQMLEKIHTSDAGRPVRITYKGESGIRTAGNPMRLFDILVNTKAAVRDDLLMDTSLLEMLQDES
jgi:hypothetical protein